MFDDNDGVAQVAQLLERANQTVVVALMQSDAGLVEDVEHVDQLRANLRGQSDALALAAGQRGRLTVQRQIVQTDLQEEVQARADLLENLGGNLLLLVVEVGFCIVEPLAQFAEVHVAQLRDVLVPDAVRQCLAVQAHAVTLRALALRQELVGPLGTGIAVVAFHHGAQVLHHAVVVDEVVAGGVNQILVDADALQRAVEDFVECLLGNVVDARLQVAVVLVENGVNLPEDHLALILAQRYDTAFVDALLAVGDDLREVYLVDVAQSLAARTGTLR